jgi:hypothetical protein
LGSVQKGKIRSRKTRRETEAQIVGGWPQSYPRSNGQKMGCIPEKSEDRCEENSPSSKEGRSETEVTESGSEGPGGNDDGSASDYGVIAAHSRPGPILNLAGRS